MREPADFSVLDVESLRSHYAKTLEHWLRGFERSYDTVVHPSKLDKWGGV